MASACACACVRAYVASRALVLRWRWEVLRDAENSLGFKAAVGLLPGQSFLIFSRLPGEAAGSGGDLVSQNLGGKSERGLPARGKP